MRRGSSSLARVRSDEWRLFSLSAAFSFGAVALAIFIRTWSDTLFLTHFSTSHLPVFFIWSAFAFAPVTIGYTWLSKQVSPTRLNTATLIVFSASSLMCLYPSEHPLTLFLTLLFMSLVSPLVNAICWGVILERISSLQAKRLIPLISGAATIGAVSAGIIAAEVIEWGGLTGLMGLVTLTLIALAALPSALLSSSADAAVSGSGTSGSQAERYTAAPSDSADSQEDAREPQAHDTDIPELSWAERLASLRTSRLLTLIALATLIMATTTNLVDYLFKAQAQASLTSAELGPFIARFHAVTNAFIFVIQIAFLGPLTTRLGLKWSFPLYPLSLSVVTSLCLIPFGWMTFVLLRGVDTLMKFTVHSNTENLILTPVPLVLRTQTKVILKGAIYPLGGLIAGLTIWSVNAISDWCALDSIIVLLGIVLTLCVIWVSATLKSQVYYWEQLALNLNLPTERAQRAPNIEVLRALLDHLESSGEMLPHTPSHVRHSLNREEVDLEADPHNDARLKAHVKETLRLIARSVALEDHLDSLSRCWRDDRDRADLIEWFNISASWVGVRGLSRALEHYSSDVMSAHA